MLQGHFVGGGGGNGDGRVAEGRVVLLRPWTHHPGVVGHLLLLQLLMKGTHRLTVMLVSGKEEGCEGSGVLAGVGVAWTREERKEEWMAGG